MIAEVLESYGADVPRGYGWKALRCPFHPDSRASASVHIGDGLFKCHACDIKGNAVQVIMRHEGVSYADAVERAQSLSRDGDEHIPSGADRVRRGYGVSREAINYGQHSPLVPPGVRGPTDERARSVPPSTGHTVL